MERKNVKNKDHHKEYTSRMYTPEGFKVFSKVLENYVKHYITKTDYPFSPVAMLGLPNYRAFIDIQSKEDLLGRIKILATLLGVPTIELIDDKGNKRVADILYMCGGKD